jgi:hypothetical protein
MFGVVSATFSTYREQEAGYEVRSAEIAYFTDLSADSVIQAWTNPYTKEVVDVPASSLPPTTALIGKDMRFQLQGSAPPGVEFSQSVSQPKGARGEVWFTESIAAKRHASPPEPAFFYNDTTVLRARLADLEAADTSPPNCATSFQSVVSWRTWLKMGSHPGCMVGFGNGSYGITVDELPPAWIKETTKRRPEILRDPAMLLRTDSQQPR